MIVGYTVGLLPPQMKITERHLAPLSEYLDEPRVGTAISRRRAVNAFAAVIDLPRRNAYLGAVRAGSFRTCADRHRR